MNNLNDKIKCPECNDYEARDLSNHVIKFHKMKPSDFKIKHNLIYLVSEYVLSNNPTKGRKRTDEEKLLMSKNRKGKGIGISGKYERTKEIKEKVSISVAKAHLRGDFDQVRPGIREYVYSYKMDREIFTRSTWEADLVRILDIHPRVNEFYYEYISIPYEFEGQIHNYIPDFYVIHDEVIGSYWEVKRDDYIENDAKTKVKIKTLKKFCENKYNCLIVDSKVLKDLRKYAKSIDPNYDSYSI